MLDELTPIGAYMAHEMTANANGRDAQKMAALNSVSSEGCIAEYLKGPWWRKLFGMTPRECISLEITSHEAALLMWAAKVMQNSDWDHKPKIAARFYSPTAKSRFWFAYDTTLYFYDIWSNIHYGYVGSAAGFSEDVLLDGAGLEQIGSDLLRGNTPVRSPNVSGLRAFDDPSDRASISMGVELYGVSPNLVTAKQLVTAIISANASLSTKPIPR